VGWVYYYTIILATGNRQGWALDKIDLLHYLDRDTGRPLQYDFLTDLHQKRFFFGGGQSQKKLYSDTSRYSFTDNRFTL